MRDRNTDDPTQLYERANSLGDEGRYEEALAGYARTLEIEPEHALAYKGCGVALQRLHRFHAALASYERALELAPDLAAAHSNRGSVLKELGRFEEALHSLNRALELQPELADAHNNRGNLLTELGRHEEALDDYERAMKLSPRFGSLFGLWLHTRRRICDWRGLDAHVRSLLARLDNAEAVTPFAVLGVVDSPAAHRRAAELWGRARYPGNERLGPVTRRDRGGPIRVAYFSADFHDHATAHLVAELFELHDRRRFALTAFCFGPQRADAMRRRLYGAFEDFRDVHRQADEEIARQSRALEIDIAVDLKGYTQGSRPGIFACRAAPIQLGFLGYPGTMGARYMDYLVADRIVIPAEYRRHYSENILYLPNSCQVNDRRREIAEVAFSRTELGLPDAGFVFCCFNASYKIMPATFEVWMRILRRVPGAVLWLLNDNDTAARNLRAEARARGVDDGRLRFAPRISSSRHLARQRAADLFLDTLPYNAHTTASDALWAGLPVLTCVGQSFPGRVGASLLTAIDMPELITTTMARYEELAVELANDAGRLATVKAKLAANRLRAPLFDTPQFTRQLEAGYALIHERYHRGASLDDVFI
jgi:predicted O-linked N-acetylglucosamine transferase (SPINDLY family)